MSPASEEGVEELPRRFDGEGRRIGDGEGEIVRMVLRGVEEVLGRSGRGGGGGGWREVLRGVLEGVEREAGGGGRR